MLPSIEELLSITILASYSSLRSRSYNRLEIRRIGPEEFQTLDGMNQTTSIVSSTQVESLLEAIDQPCERPEPEMFGQSQEVLDAHFDTCTCDDNPVLHIQLKFKDDSLQLANRSSNAYLLPWQVNYHEHEWRSFNMHISLILANLMPAEFLCRERLTEATHAFNWTIESLAATKAWISEPDDDKPSLSYKEWRAKFDELQNRWADIHTNGEEVKYSPSKRDYTAQQLRRLTQEQLIELVANGFDLSTSDETGQTALMHTASPPLNRDQFWNLVRAGADVNAKRADGSTGLMQACAGGMDETAKEWLLAGADVHLRCPGNSTALMLGAKNATTVEFLLQYGARAKDQDDDGDTALEYAMHDLNVFHAASRLKAIELLADQIAAAEPTLLARSYKNALEVSRKTRLEVEILYGLGSRPMSDTPEHMRTTYPDQYQSYLEELKEFIDIEITEIELADRIVEIIRNKLEQHQIDYSGEKR